ncbi:MAG: hypothetical protein ACOCXC_01780 [Fibrobacterota bacterium]
MFSRCKLNIEWHSGIIFAGILALASATGAQTPCVPLVVSDSQAIKDLASAGFSERIPGAEYRVCVRDDLSGVLIVFRDGTQIGELSQEKTEQFLQRYPQYRQEDRAEPAHRKPNRAEQLWGEESFCALLIDENIPVKRKLDAFLELGSWPTGFSLADRFDMAASRTLVIRNTVHVDYLGRLFFVYAGVGFHGSSFHGSLAEELQGDSLNHFNNGSLSWTIGLPFIRYEMKQAGWVIPEYFWLEDDMASMIYLGEQGETLAGMSRRWSRGHKGNVGHALYMKAGHFHFDMIFDGDLYRKTISRVSLDSLPFIWGTWGASLTRASDVWVPGAWIQTPRISVNLFSYSGFDLPFTMEPLRFHFHYWNLRRYNVGFSTRMTFDLKKSRQETIDEQ